MLTQRFFQLLGSRINATGSTVTCSTLTSISGRHACQSRAWCLRALPSETGCAVARTHSTPAAALQLSKMVLPGMKERGRGVIINVGSGAATVIPSSPLLSGEGPVQLGASGPTTPEVMRHMVALRSSAWVVVFGVLAPCLCLA